MVAGTSLLAEPPILPDSALFEGPMRHFIITVAPDQLGVLADRRSSGHGAVRATGRVQVGTNDFTDVRLQTKGSGSFRPIQYRPSLTLKFKSAQPCFGLTKLHLNNSVHDPSRLNEMLGGELHRQAGVPAPRATPVRVTLNGRYLGVYVLIEGFDRRFLSRHFPDSSGNLYDPSWGQDIDSNLECDSGPAKQPRNIRGGQAAVEDAAGAPSADLQRLREAVALPADRRLAGMSKILDIDRFLSGMSLQILTDDWDGYARHHNNFRLYHEPISDRFVFLPHGMDFLFNAPRSVIYWPRFEGLVAEALFSTPGVADRLRHRMEDLEQNVFVESNLLRLVDRKAADLMAGLAEQPQRERDFYARQIALSRQRIVERARVLRDGLPSPPEMKVGEARMLTDWEPWAEVPDTDLREEVRPDGRMVLTIRANSRATCASWRTRMLLPAGVYQFQGVVDVEGLRIHLDARDPGVGLRVVPNRRGMGLQGTQKNARLEHSFSLRVPNEVIFVAELSGHQGSAAFLRESLRVVRLGNSR